jgi:hypothetical protein
MYLDDIDIYFAIMETGMITELFMHRSCISPAVT